MTGESKWGLCRWSWVGVKSARPVTCAFALQHKLSRHFCWCLRSVRQPRRIQFLLCGLPCWSSHFYCQMWSSRWAIISFIMQCPIYNKTGCNKKKFVSAGPKLPSTLMNEDSKQHLEASLDHWLPCVKSLPLNGEVTLSKASVCTCLNCIFQSFVCAWQWSVPLLGLFPW